MSSRRSAFCFSSKLPSGAKARVHFACEMYGLKPVPFILGNLVRAKALTYQPRPFKITSIQNSVHSIQRPFKTANPMQNAKTNSLRQMQRHQRPIYSPDTDKRGDDAADAVEQQIVAQQNIGRLGLVFDALEG